MAGGPPQHRLLSGLSCPSVGRGDQGLGDAPDSETTQTQAHQEALNGWAPAGTVTAAGPSLPPSPGRKGPGLEDPPPRPSPAPTLRAQSGLKVHSVAPTRARARVRARARARVRARADFLAPQSRCQAGPPPPGSPLTRSPAHPAHPVSRCPGVPEPWPRLAPTRRLPEPGMNGMFPGPREGLRAGGGGAWGRARSPGHPGSSPDGFAPRGPKEPRAPLLVWTRA